MGANYRAACRGRSKADFVAKAGILLEEADECLYWMEMLQEAGIIPADKLKDLMKKSRRTGRHLHRLHQNSQGKPQIKTWKADTTYQ